MYHRVNLRAYAPSPGALLSRLPPPTEARSPDGQCIYRGGLGHFRYSLKGELLRLRGALSDFTGPVPPSEVAPVAIQRLSDRLGFDAGAFEVTRVEVYADLALSQPVCLYLPLLVTLARHKRLTVQGADGSGETLKFFTTRRALQFYDKARQSGRRGPLLRVELSYQSGGVAEQLGRGVSLASLASPAFRYRISQTFHAQYQRVEKGRALRTGSGAPDFFDALAIEGLYNRGIGNVLAEIKAHHKAGLIDGNEARDRRRDILHRIQNPAYTEPSPLVVELDGAIAEAAAEMRR